MLRKFCRLSILHSLLFVLIAALIGMMWGTWRAEQRLETRLHATLENIPLVFDGVICALPDVSIDRTRLIVCPDAKAQQAGIPAQISLNVYQKTPLTQPLQPEQNWRWQAKLKRPHGTLNFSGLDAELWLLEQNIGATGSVKNANYLGQQSSLRGRIAYWRQQIRAQIQANNPDPRTQALVSALVMGDQQSISQADWRLFSHTGVTHLVSISGLHLTMLAGLIGSLVWQIWRRTRLTLWLPARQAALMVGCCSAFAYALIAGYAVPTQRTFYMLSLCAFAWWRGTPANIQRVLVQALSLTVLIDPWAIISPSTWLSFGAVAGMALGSAGQLRPVSWLKTAWQAQWSVLWIGTPMLLFWFQSIPIYSTLANALAIPLVSLILTPLSLLSVILPIKPLFYLLHLSTQLLYAWLNWISQLPYLQWQQATPSTPALLAFLVGAIIFLLPRGIVIRWIGVIWMLPALLTTNPKPSQNGTAWITVFDVGQGLSVLVQTTQHNLLYDTGPDWQGERDSGNQIIAPNLRALGIRKLDGLMISHNDNDHSGGTMGLLEQQATPDWLLHSLPENSPILAAIPNALQCEAGQSWTHDGVIFETLAPSAERILHPSDNDNAQSCVVRINGGTWQVLLTGDLPEAGEAELIHTQNEKLASNLLIVPHHGSKTSSSWGFIRAVSPQLAIFTNGYLNHFNHPNPEVFARYQSLGVPTLQSDQDGAIQIQFSPTGAFTTHTARQTRQRYWQARK